MTGSAMNAVFGEVSADLADDFVGLVEIHRPPANYFDAPLLRDVVAAMAWVEQLGGRAVVLASEGKHFCAGMDFRARADRDDGGRDGTLYAEGQRLFRQPLPVVAAIQGGAIGGGLGLALAADFRVADTDSRFHANFARLGLHHGFGMTVTLPAVIGPQRAAELLLTGRRVDAPEALAIGLCDRLSEPGQVRSTARTLAADIAAAAPLAVRSIRATLRLGLADRIQAATEHELREQVALSSTADFKEGVRAARERRAPDFTGR